MAADPFLLVAARKAAEMRAKCGALMDELAAWRALAGPRGRFEKHHSQIGRLATQLESAVATIRARLADDIPDTTILARSRVDEILLLELHRVWDFFRSKLLQRTEPYRDYLVVADELAWACYEPAVRRANAMRKEPPLTFFNSEQTPYAIERDKAYVSEIGEGPIRGPAAAELLKTLPIPVIGVPWFQASHLPDLLMTAHEVGHHVENDLRLTHQLRAAVAAAVGEASRRAAWLSWSGEVFADLYGTLAAGPAFAVSLAGFLASVPTSIATERLQEPSWGYYPTAYLRMLVALMVLRRGFMTESDALRASWRQAFPTNAMSAFEADVLPLVDALLTTQFSFEGTTFRITDLISFSQFNQSNATTALNAAFGGEAIQTNEVRELIAAAALGFAARPADFNEPVGEKAPQRRVMDHVLANIQSGLRSEAQLEQMKWAVVKWQVSDQTAGTGLLEQLSELALGDA